MANLEKFGELSPRLAVQKQSFYSPETQNGRRVIKVYSYQSGRVENVAVDYYDSL